jgi:N-ethylmaleimide reductase
MSDSSALFSPITAGNIELANRIAMAPLTRARASPDGVPNVELAGKYYVDRAAAGLIITEATSISPVAVGWYRAPAIYTQPQIEAWRQIVERVHSAGGKIALQLWHTGRVSHPSFQPEQQLPVAPSAVAADGHTHTPQGAKAPYVTPRALTTDEVAAIVGQYVAAALNAKLAGFDAIEIHAANGYLVDQFLRDGSNHRTDQYGGSIENRARFLLDIVDAISAAWHRDHVGVRISPTGTYNDMRDSDPLALATYVAQQLNHRKIAFMHVVEPLPGGWGHNPDAPLVTPAIRSAFHGTLIVNGGYNADTGAAAIQSGAADVVAYGWGWISTPDLVHRIKIGAQWNAPDYATFYTHEEKGYTDYPTLAEVAVAAQ